MSRLAAVAAGIAADRWLGEPPTALHPVAWFGTAMQGVEQILWRDARVAGAAHAAVGVGGAWLTGVALRRLLGARPATFVATALCVAGRMLDDEATAVGQLLVAGEVAAARDRLRSLVGRDAAALDR